MCKSPSSSSNPKHCETAVEFRRKKRKEKRELNVERTRSLRQSELAFLGPSEQTPPPSTLITDLALKYRPGFRHQVYYEQS